MEEAVGSLQFAANPIPEAGSIDQDRNSHIGDDDDLNPLPVTGNINQERRDDEIGGSDDIQIVDRWTYRIGGQQLHIREYSVG